MYYQYWVSSTVLGFDWVLKVSLVWFYPSFFKELNMSLGRSVDLAAWLQRQRWQRTHPCLICSFLAVM